MAARPIPPVYATLPAETVGSRLREGDYTTVDRFRPARAAAPHLPRAELLRGIVRLNDAPRSARRTSLTTALKAWARQYEVETPGVVLAVDVRATLSPRDEAFCDAALYVPADRRCVPAADADGAPRLEGPPALALCVSEEKGDRDLGDRIEALRQGGVTEFVAAGAGGGLQWFRLDADPRRPGRGGGYLKSAVFPGLWLPESVLNPDPEKVDVVAAVRAGCGTLDHALFVNGLCSRKPR